MCGMPVRVVMCCACGVRPWVLASWVWGAGVLSPRVRGVLGVGCGVPVGEGRMRQQESPPPPLPALEVRFLRLAPGAACSPAACHDYQPVCSYLAIPALAHSRL